MKSKSEIEEKVFKPFDIFDNQWGLVTAGTHEKFNTCTIGWGSMGTIWGGPTQGRPIITVYVNPQRYTWQFLKESPYFTVSFFPEQYRKALGYLGSHSGRDGDKIRASGLTPVPMGDGVAFKEANLVFLCRKLYQHGFAEEDMIPEIRDFYKKIRAMNPTPHWEFIGEVVDFKDTRNQ